MKEPAWLRRDYWPIDEFLNYHYFGKDRDFIECSINELLKDEPVLPPRFFELRDIWHKLPPEVRVKLERAYDGGYNE